MLKGSRGRFAVVISMKGGLLRFMGSQLLPSFHRQKVHSLRLTAYFAKKIRSPHHLVSIVPSL